MDSMSTLGININLLAFIRQVVIILFPLSFIGLMVAKYLRNRKWTVIFEVITGIFALLLLIGLISLLFIE